MVLFTLLFLLTETNPNHITETDIYQVMLPEETFVSPAGEVYILNFGEARIQYYDPTGKRTKTIGRRGKGPGEFTFPIKVALANNQLHVYDKLTGMISVFAADGTFKEQFKVPINNLELFRTAGGWLYWTTQDTFEETKATQLMWTDDHFKTSKTIMDITEQGWSRGMSSHASSSGQRRIEWSPISVKPQLLVSPDGATIYFAAKPWQFEITVIDGHTGKIINTIKKDADLIPFDAEWADEKFNQETSMHLRGSGISASDIDKLYPEHFPIIRAMKLDPDGNLMVSRWRGRPDKNHHVIGLTPTGEAVPTTYAWPTLRRLLGVAQGNGYIMCYDGQEASIAKVPLAELDAFVENNPIEDWSFSRSMSISN